MQVLLHSYFLIGYVFDGTLTAAAGLRDAGEPMASSEYSTGITGYSLRWAVGPHLIINYKWFPVFIGMNAVIYSRTYLSLEHGLPVYNNSITELSCNDFENELFEVVLGIHF